MGLGVGLSTLPRKSKLAPETAPSDGPVLFQAFTGLSPASHGLLEEQTMQSFH